MKRLMGLGLVAWLSMGCSGSGVEEDVTSDEASATKGPVTAETNKVDGSELKVRAGLLTVWVDAVALPAQKDNKQVIVITGRASRNLEDVFSFVPDDPFGTAKVIGKRGFEVTLDYSGEQVSILAGSGLLVRLKTATGAKESYFARIFLEPKFARYSGSSKIFLQDAIKPIYYFDGASSLRFRGSATLDGYTASFNAFADDEGDPVVSKVSSQKYNFDWTFEKLMIAADPPKEPVHFSAMVNGLNYTKDAGISFAVPNVGLTSADPYDTWPQAQCEAKVKACVQAKPAAAVDFSDCGSYRQVRSCRLQ